MMHEISKAGNRRAANGALNRRSSAGSGVAPGGRRGFRERAGIVLEITLATVTHRKLRSLLTAAGVGAAFFLAAAQIGLLVGWVRTNTALIRHAEVDLWVMAEQTPAWDYGSAIPSYRIQQARAVPGVEWAEGLFMAWNVWQRPDGRRVNVELVGLDDDGVGGPWQMTYGDIDCVQRRETVIVDQLYLGELGVTGPGEVCEMFGERAVVGGVSAGVRTFTASPHVFTSIDQAIRYDKRYRGDQVTYVLARCRAGAEIEAVQTAMRARIPDVEVLTSAEFATRSASYWMLGTGVGITVVVTAALGLLVGGVVTSQTLFATTQEHLGHYQTLRAIGFGSGTLSGVVLVQALLAGVAGVGGGSCLYFPISRISASTPIPLEMTPLVFGGLVAITLGSCAVASFLSLRTIWNLDPAAAFSQ